MGHLDRVEEIERLTDDMEGLALAGGAYRGVGVPNCLDSGEKAVTKVLGEWGIALEEDAVEEKRLY
jgi:oxygen-dependent protoporphyrinogen oxidase